jgi:hypothetical protein
MLLLTCVPPAPQRKPVQPAGAHRRLSYLWHEVGWLATPGPANRPACHPSTPPRRRPRPAAAPARRRPAGSTARRRSWRGCGCGCGWTAAAAAADMLAQLGRLQQLDVNFLAQGCQVGHGRGRQPAPRRPVAHWPRARQRRRRRPARRVRSGCRVATGARASPLPPPACRWPSLRWPLLTRLVDAASAASTGAAPAAAAPPSTQTLAAR